MTERKRSEETTDPTDAAHAGGKPGAELRQQQHTGNHDRPERAGGGADRFGGTRAGADNVEPSKKDEA
jgi:hypothetical protein